MNAQSAFGNRSAARKQRGGYSLMELMIVVAITGILAAIAIPSFSSYIQKSRTTEAVEFLGVIKLRQEAYRAEFGAYFVCGKTLPSDLTDTDFVPGGRSVMRNGQKVPFPNNNACFNAIGAKPGGDVRFGYAWAAGLPGQEGPLEGVPYNVPANGHDHFFVAQAITDLDGDGTVCTYELTSFTPGVWYSPATGWE